MEYSKDLNILNSVISEISEKLSPLKTARDAKQAFPDSVLINLDLGEGFIDASTVKDKAKFERIFITPYDNHNGKFVLECVEFSPKDKTLAFDIYDKTSGRTIESVTPKTLESRFKLYFENTQSAEIELE